MNHADLDENLYASEQRSSRWSSWRSFCGSFLIVSGQKLAGKKSSPGQNERAFSLCRWRTISHPGRCARNAGKGIHGSLFLRRDERRDRNGGHKSLERLSLNVIGSWPIGVVGRYTRRKFSPLVKNWMAARKRGYRPTSRVLTYVYSYKLAISIIGERNRAYVPVASGNADGKAKKFAERILFSRLDLAW